MNVVGGLQIDEPAADLAVAAAIASSWRDIPVKADSVLIAEIGLAGELRMPGQMQARLREAQKLGFKTAIVPKALRKGEPYPQGIRDHRGAIHSTGAGRCSQHSKGTPSGAEGGVTLRLRRATYAPFGSARWRAAFCNSFKSPSYKEARRRFFMNAKIILAILVLALASLACGFNIDLPERPKAGP